MTKLLKTPFVLSTDAAPLSIRSERASDVVAREALLDACFGTSRASRTCQRLREGHAPAEGLSFSAVRGDKLVGTVRLWHVSAGGVPALVLGPLAVDPSCRKLGIGAALIKRALGDAPYYARFGFSAQKTGLLTLPGPFERERLLGLELSEGALAAGCGMIVATGAFSPKTKAACGKNALRAVPCAA